MRRYAPISNSEEMEGELEEAISVEEPKTDPKDAMIEVYLNDETNVVEFKMVSRSKYKAKPTSARSCWNFCGICRSCYVLSWVVTTSVFTPGLLGEVGASGDIQITGVKVLGGTGHGLIMVENMEQSRAKSTVSLIFLR